MTKYKPTALSISPTMVVGVGGSGVETMRLVKARVRNSLSPLPGIIEFLALDTEPRPNPPDAERIAQREYVYLGDYNATKVLTNLDAHPHIKHWWFDEGELVTGSIYKGARQRRPVGRLSLYVNWGKFTRLFSVKAARIREISRKEKEQTRGVEVERHTGLVKVYIVGSLCGGTGSGVLLDVAFKVRETFGDDADISGVFLLPSCFLRELQSLKQSQRIQANAYAALREINHFLQGHTFTTVFPDHPFSNGQGDVMEDRLNRPFDALYLIDRNNGKEAISTLDSVFAMVAQYVFLDIVSPIGSKLDARRSNLRDLAGESSKTHEQASAQPLAVSTFATASLTLPTNKLSSIALNAFCEGFVRQHLIGTHIPDRQVVEVSDERFRVLKDSFRFENTPGSGSRSVRERLLGTADNVDLSKFRVVLREALAQIQHDLNADFDQHGLAGVQRNIDELQARVREEVKALDGEIARLQSERDHLNQGLKPMPSESIVKQLIDSVMGIFVKETPIQKRRRQWETNQTEFRQRLTQTSANLDQEKGSQKAFTAIQVALAHLRADIEERLRLLEGILSDMNGTGMKTASAGARERDSGSRQGDGLFELATEVDLALCKEFLSDFTIQSGSSGIISARVLDSEQERNLRRAFRETLFSCIVESNSEGSTLRLSALPDQPAAKVQQMLTVAFGGTVSTGKLRIVEYLKWFYDHMDYDGKDPRYTPIDPLQMLQDRCQRPFLETEPAHLGSERASDTEDIRLVGVDKSRVEDPIGQEVLEDFDSDTYTEVITAVPERLDLLFSKHGYPIRVLKNLEDFKKNYDHFLEFEREKLHLQRGWPSGMDQLIDTHKGDGVSHTPSGVLVGKDENSDDQTE